MKRNLPSLLRGLVCTGALLLMGISSSYASHIVAAELRYKWISGLTYEITMYLYGDCGASSRGAFMTLPTSAPSICIYDGPTSVATISLPIVDPTAGLEVTPVCHGDSLLTQCTNTSYAIPGIKKFVYTKVYTFPHSSAHWRLIYAGDNGGGSAAGRAAAITNLFSPGSTYMSLTDTLNTLAGPNTRGHNSSPVLTLEPIPFFCADSGITDCFNPGAVDLYDTSRAYDEPSGDSLLFQLVPATDGIGGCGGLRAIGYVSPQCPGGPTCTGTEPLTRVDCTPASFSFDPSTGQLCFQPELQRSTVVYNIEEFRNDTAGNITTIGGDGIAGFSGDAGSALLAQIHNPSGICFDGAGNIYFADNFNNRIRKISPLGAITTVAGTGVPGYTGDGGSALAAKLNNPMGVAVDASGVVYFADNNNNVIRRINGAGIINTIAGNGTAGFGGDGGLATAAGCELNRPYALHLDATNNIFISDDGNQRIRKVTPAGIISTVAGNGVAGYAGDGGPAAAATCQVNNPAGLTTDAIGNLYFADVANNVIREITTAGVISTFAGVAGAPGYSGDAGPAIAAKFNSPTDIFCETSTGLFFIDDRLNNCIREIDITGAITTIAGTGAAGYSGDGGPAVYANLNNPPFLCLDPSEDIYISDFNNNRIRKVVPHADIIKVLVGTMQREMTFEVLACSYTNPTGNIDSFAQTGTGDTLNNVYYFGCANSGDFNLYMNPREPDTSLHISVVATGLPSGITIAVAGNNTDTPHVTITGNTNVMTPGTYTFYLNSTDDHCPLTGSTSTPFTVQILPVPTITDSVISKANCTDSAAYMIIPGGSGKPWTMKIWQRLGGGVGDTFQVFTDTTAFIDSIAPGFDSITIYTSVSNLCAVTHSLIVDSFKFPTENFSTSPSYCGAPDGSILVSGLHAGKLDVAKYFRSGLVQPPQTFTVPPSAVDTLPGLLAGAYIIQIFEGFCESDTMYSTLVNPPFTMGTVTFSSPTKCGFCDGRDTIWGLHPNQLDTITYGFQSLPITGPPVLRSIGHFVTSDSIVVLSGLCEGNYTNFVINTANKSNCADSCCSISPRAPMLTDEFDTALHYGCFGDTLMLTNHSTPAADLLYHWDFGDGSTSSDVSPMHIYTNTTNNTVTVSLDITNTKCVDTFATVVYMNNFVHASYSMVPPRYICQGDLVTFTNTSIGASPGTNAAPTYTWVFGDGATDTSFSPTHTFVNTNAYTIKLVAANTVPCYDTVSRILQVDSLSVVSIQATDSVICRGQSITFTGIYTSIGDTGNAWVFGDANSIVNVNPVIHSYDDTGIHTVAVTTLYRACPEESSSRTIYVIQQPDLYLGPDRAICPGGNPIAILDDRNQGLPDTKWLWNTGDTSAGIMVDKPGYYSVMVTKNGCSAYDTVWVQKDCYMDIPNVFSPNGDGTNDYFYPRQLLTKGLVKFKMDIYNRWGQLIYETTNTDGRGWDGAYNGVPQPGGVYVYLIEATFKDGQIENHQGNVTLLR